LLNAQPRKDASRTASFLAVAWRDVTFSGVFWRIVVQKKTGLKTVIFGPF